MKKLTLLAAFIFFNCIMESCTDSLVTCYNLTIDNAYNFTYSDFTDLEPRDTTAAIDYAIALDASGSKATCMIDISSFGASLMAEQPIYEIRNGVVNVSITSNQDLNAAYSAGSELKDLFSPGIAFPDCFNNGTEPSQCSEDYYEYAYYDTLEGALNGIMGENFLLSSVTARHTLALKTEEEITNQFYEFTVTIDFLDGSVTEVRTAPVYLN